MQLRTEIEIDASPSQVWEVLSQTDLFPEWNPFLVSLTGELVQGERISITVAPPDGSEMSFRPRLLKVAEGEEIRWRGKLLFEFLFAGEHFIKLLPLDRGGTRVVHGEDFSGFLVRFLGGQLDATRQGFILMNQALKRRVESTP